MLLQKNNKTTSQTSLKSKNAPYLWTFVGINFAVFFALTIGPHLDYTSVQHFWERISAKDGFIVACMPLIVIIANGLLSDNLKACLVFWRWENPLPGCRAFSILMNSDPRIDTLKLKIRHGVLPRSPKKQNALWYRLYQKHSSDVTVLDCHRLYLLTRDLTAIAALFIFPFTTVMVFYRSEKIAICLYALFLLLQYISIAIAAKNYGNRLVSNVLAQESQSE